MFFFGTCLWNLINDEQIYCMMTIAQSWKEIGQSAAAGSEGTLHKSQLKS